MDRMVRSILGPLLRLPRRNPGCPTYRKGNETLDPIGPTAWVDLPRNATGLYAPTPGLVEQLVAKAPPGTVAVLSAAFASNYL